MRRSSTFIACLAVLSTGFLATTIAVADAPRLAFPINSQLPPVAYVDQPYDFAFAPNTFTAQDDDGLAYSLVSSPAWLSVDGHGQRLLGTPEMSDVGAASFRLMALNDKGRAVDEVTLVVKEDRTLAANADILSQLANAGKTATPAALLLHPLEPFSFVMSRTTFNGVSDQTHFYVVSADGTPLPSWIYFDSNSLKISGTAPPMTASIQGQQTYSFILAASDVVGFSEVTIQFQLIITTHILAFSHPRQTISITKGQEVYIQPLLQQLTLDDKAVQRQDLTSILSLAPAWLTLNDSDLSFRGTTPKDAQNQAFPFSVTEQAGTVANATVLLQISDLPAVVQLSLGIENASAGQYFIYTFQQPNGFQDRLRVESDMGQVASWLIFDASNLTIHGQVPHEQNPGLYNVTVTFIFAEKVAICTLVISVKHDPSGGQGTSAFTSPMASATAVVEPKSKANDKNWSARDKVKLGLKIGLPILVVIALVIIFLYLRRRQVRKSSNKQMDRKDMVQITSNNEQILRTEGRSSNAAREGTPEAPQVELSWAPDSMPRAHNRLSSNRAAQRRSGIESNWTNLMSPTPLTTANAASTTPQTSVPKQLEQVIDQPGPSHSPSRRRSSRMLVNPRLSLQSHPFRASASSASISFGSMGLPKRISGAGHGAGLNPMLHREDLCASWYTTYGSIPGLRSRPQTMILNNFPAPPSQNDKMPAKIITEPPPRFHHKSTLRRVQDENTNLSPFEAARQEYYTERARYQFEGASRFTNNSSVPRRSPSRLLPTVTSRGKPGAMRAMAVRSGNDPRPSSSVWSFGSPVASQSIVDWGLSLPKHSISVASSGQFDSAVSSESQWEDEELAAEDDNRGGQMWHSIESPSRLPFQTHRQGVRGSQDISHGSAPRPRTVDQRRKVNMGMTAGRQADKSQHGSLRFV